MYVIAKPLTHVINLSLSTGIVPNELKAARVNPVFKTGETHKFDNYRPISILPVISKIFEKCVHNQLMNYLESNKLLSSKQFGFRRKRSTELATAYFIDKIHHAMDKGEYTAAIYVDLSKAFDTISHAMIVNKPPKFGITGVAQQWIASYLFARQQQVSSPIFCRVSQGSILGLLLFLLVSNDSTETLSTCHILMYADDIVILFYSNKDLKKIEEHLSRDFHPFATWLACKELIINTKIGKTETVLFGTVKSLQKLTILHSSSSTKEQISITLTSTNILV